MQKDSLFPTVFRTSIDVLRTAMHINDENGQVNSVYVKEIRREDTKMLRITQENFYFFLIYEIFK